MNAPTPKDPRCRAFAEALAEALAHQLAAELMADARAAEASGREPVEAETTP